MESPSKSINPVLMSQTSAKKSSKKKGKKSKLNDLVNSMSPEEQDTFCTQYEADTAYVRKLQYDINQELVRNQAK